MNEIQIQTKIGQLIHGTDPNAEVYLFGSRARGDYRIDSDWDVIILVDNKLITNEIEDEFRDGLYALELESGQIISTFIYPKDFWTDHLRFSPLYKNVYSEGVKL